MQGLFCIRVGCEVLFQDTLLKLLHGPEEDVPEDTQRFMEKVLTCLKEHQLPDAEVFEKECIAPLYRMQAHVERLFQAVPREQARRYAAEQYRDDRAWMLERRAAVYRLEFRGRPDSAPWFFKPIYERQVATINANLAAQAQSIP